MKKDIKEPELSPDFTVEDIRKVRDYHYELTKDMTFEERQEFYREGMVEFREYMEQLKQQEQITAI